MADADLLGSDTLAAVIVTVAGDGAVAGTVYSPVEEIVPQVAPLQPVPDSVQVTAVFDVPVTEAANCCVVPTVVDTLAGVTATTITGTIIRFADADLVGSTTLVAITLTLAGVGATDGAK